MKFLTAMKHSIRNWLILPFVGLFLIPLMILGSLLTLQNYSNERERVKQEQQKLTVLASKEITSLIRGQQQSLEVLLKANYLPRMNKKEKIAAFGRFMVAMKDENKRPVFNKISLLDDKGHEVIQVTRKELNLKRNLRDLSKANIFQIPASTGNIYYSPVYFNEATGEPFIMLCAPVNDIRTQALYGVVVAEKNLKSIWQTVSTMKIGKSGTAFITYSDGEVIAHRNRSVVLRGTHFVVPDKATIMKGLSGDNALIASNRIELGDQFFYFITEVPVSEALKHINTIILLVGVFFLFFLLGGLLFGNIVVRQIVKPIETLADKARKISKGDMTQGADIQSKDEVGELANAFNVMTSKLFTTISQLSYEKNFVRNIIESMTHPFYVINVKDRKVILANSAATGSLSAENETCHQLNHDMESPCYENGHLCPIDEILKTREPVVLEHVHKIEGKAHTFEVYGYPVFDEHGEVVQVIEYNLDVTEKKNLELQLQQSQKLEAIGTLTGGVAHDFNNLLTTIIGYSQLYLMEHDEDDSDRNAIEAVFEAADKATGLVSQLLAFSRKSLMDLKVINLNTLVTDVSKMLTRLIGEDIEIQMFLKEKIGNIKADSGQVEQVIINLVVNAKDAMPNGGKLYFESDSVELDEEYCRAHANITPGKYVVLGITDTGSGIPQDVKEKIFDPFFTTKKEGQGTGLGLSTVYGIVSQMQGHIYVYSELDRGTTFKIYFPEIQEEAAEFKKEKVTLRQGTETIMVVDDEMSILLLIKDTLQPLGYDIKTASSAENALEMFKELKEVDLLLTDVIMQNMNGMELYEKLKLVQTDLKVLFMSGYTDNVIAQKGIIKEGINFIPKPIFPTTLTVKIREIMDEELSLKG